jgi:hypothetical protein
MVVLSWATRISAKLKPAILNCFVICVARVRFRSKAALPLFPAQLDPSRVVASVEYVPLSAYIELSINLLYHVRVLRG